MGSHLAGCDTEDAFDLEETKRDNDPLKNKNDKTLCDWDLEPVKFVDDDHKHYLSNKYLAPF